MDRIIEVRVNGDHISKDSRYAGVQYEANAKRLRLSFDEGWDNYAKKVTFWNALGGNPTTRTLTADLLEDLTKSTRIYLCPIPGEVMTEAGEIEFAIDGWANGVRQRTVGDKLSVKSSPYDENAAASIDPTPSQAEQLQQQIDSMLDEISEQAAIAYESAESAAKDAAAAIESGNKGEMAAQYAKEAQESAAIAVSAASSADEAMQRAEAAAQSAAESEAFSRTVVDAVRNDTNAAKGSAEEAKAAAATAVAAKEGIVEAEKNAHAYAQSAAAHHAGAAQAKEAAEQAAREAQQVAGGDFATPAYVAAAAQAAENNAKSYTDQKFSSIPTPDVSAQISAHDADDGAHQDIRASLMSKAEFFVCTTATKNAEIEAAVNAGKIVMMKYGNYMLQYSERESSTHHVFCAAFEGQIRIIRCIDNGWYSSVSEFVPTDHAASNTNYGEGTETLYGHLKLSDATDSTLNSYSGGTAATPSAVKRAIEIAKAASLPIGGGTLQGKLTLNGLLILTEGMHYGTSAQRPGAGIKGRVWLEEM